MHAHAPPPKSRLGRPGLLGWLACGWPRARSTTMLSTTTSLKAVEREARIMQATAPWALSTPVASVDQATVPGEGGGEGARDVRRYKSVGEGGGQ